MDKELLKVHLQKFELELKFIVEHFPKGRHPISEVILKEFQYRFGKYLD